LRADRQPEFTQIDLEMTYPQPERVWEVVEGFLTAAFASAGFAIKTPFPRMDYDEAIRLYGIDKPDLRLPPFTDVRECFAPENLQDLAINPNLPLIAIRTPKVGELSRKERDDIKPMLHSKGGAKVFEDFKRIGNKFPEAAAAIAKKTGMEDADLIVLVAGSAQAGPQTTVSEHRKVTPQELAFYASAGLLRLALAQKYADRHGIFKKTGDAAKDFRFLWVTNFPMFEWDEGDERWNAAHHPFTSPHEEDMSKLESGVEALNDPLSPLSAVRALAYDVVLNGTELGSGSIRIHRQDIQSKIFQALGMSKNDAGSRFGFFLKALEYGTPPHGGIALGLDRIVMILAGVESLREVIPFPKTARAVDLMVEAPTEVSRDQLKQLGINVRHLTVETWIQQLPKDISLERTGRRPYQTKTGKRVAVVSTSHAHKIRWSFSPHADVEVFVFLCRQHLDPLLDFVVPREALGEELRAYADPANARRLKVSVRKQGQEFLLENADSTVQIPISRYLQKYGSLS
jgi:aspartyl-tRNA synthetase